MTPLKRLQQLVQMMGALGSKSPFVHHLRLKVHVKLRRGLRRGVPVHGRLARLATSYHLQHLPFVTPKARRLAVAGVNRRVGDLPLLVHLAAPPTIVLYAACRVVAQRQRIVATELNAPFIVQQQRVVAPQRSVVIHMPAMEVVLVPTHKELVVIYKILNVSIRLRIVAATPV